MQQQQQASQQGQGQQTIPQRGPFPWRRVIVVFIIIFVLVLLAVMGLLAYGHVIDYIWLFIAPPLGSLISALVTVLAWLFPFNSVSSQLAPQDEPPSQPQSASDSTNAAQQSQAPSSIPNSPLHQPAVPAAHIFHYNEPELPSPAEFYDRQYERTTLIERSSHRASTAIMGDYRIGKSWLMQYLQQIAPTHPQLGPRVRVGRLNATNPQCQTLAGFTKRALEVLNFPARDPSPSETPLERLTIAARDLKTLGIIPVLCIDEFAGLIGLPGFDKSFVVGLRAIAEDEGLVLVTASKQPLHEVIEHIIGETSPLFGIMPQLTLKPFTESEAKTFVQEKSQQAGFSEQEQFFFLKCAALHQTDGTKQWLPLRLQLVGQMLLDDKRMAASERRGYNVQEALCQADFKRRLDDQYRAVTRHL
ncbi:MAG: hypothetical protein ACJ8CB_31470 [Ktedonobacteraceae bacterium]